MQNWKSSGCQMAVEIGRTWRWMTGEDEGQWRWGLGQKNLGKKGREN